MAVAAQFKINKTFNIVGMGLVLTGEILDGEIHSGFILEAPFEKNIIQYKIIAVEIVDYISKGESETALILEQINKEAAADLHAILGKTVLILKS